MYACILHDVHGTSSLNDVNPNARELMLIIFKFGWLRLYYRSIYYDHTTIFPIMGYNISIFNLCFNFIVE